MTAFNVRFVCAKEADGNLIMSEEIKDKEKEKVGSPEAPECAEESQIAETSETPEPPEDNGVSEAFEDTASAETSEGISEVEATEALSDSSEGKSDGVQGSPSEVLKMSVFRLAWPIFAQALLSMCLGYLDTLMLSGYTQTAVGAVGNAGQILGFLTVAFTIISGASGVMVSQYLGAGRKDKINQIYTVCFFFNVVLGLILSLLVLMFSKQLLSLINTPDYMMDDAVNYMNIVGGFIFTQAIFNLFGQIFQSNGKTIFTMVLSFAMNILNVLGNYIFLYGPLSYLNLGTSGVAISTTVSRVICIVIAFIGFKVIIKGRLSVRYLIPFPFDMLKTLLRLGIPMAGETISYDISQLFVTSFVNTLGIVAINTKVYANILCNFSYLYSVSVAMATMIIVGHAVGASDYDFAYKRVNKTMRGALLVSVSIAFINFLVSPWTFSLFTGSADVSAIRDEIITLGQQVMFIAVFLEIGRTSNLVIINSLKAAGDVKFPTYLAIVCCWICSVAGGYTLGIFAGMGLVGIWIAMAADEIVRGLVVAIRWRKGSWRGKNVVNGAPVQEASEAAQE